MSYLLEQLPDGLYRLEIDCNAVSFSMAEFSNIAATMARYERQEEIASTKSENKYKESRLLAFKDGKDLPWNSAFKYSIEHGKIEHQVISAIKYGLFEPNGTQYWSAYFSKIDWKNDGYLFEPLLRKRYGDDALAHFLKYNGDNATVAIFRHLTSKAIEDINRVASSGTHLADIGLTDSRDYTSFSYACAKIYGHEQKESSAIVDIDFAKEHLPTFIDALFDAAVFIYQNVSRKRSACPGLEHWGAINGIAATAKSIMYLSSSFDDRHWKEVCESGIWLLVKDVVSIRRYKEAM